MCSARIFVYRSLSIVVLASALGIADVYRTLTVRRQYSLQYESLLEQFRHMFFLTFLSSYLFLAICFLRF